MTQKHKTAPKKKAKMQKKLLAFMLVFAAVILSIMWVLQTVFLDDIYRSIKQTGIKADALYVASTVGRENHQENVYELAQKQNTCVTVYEIKDGMGRQTTTAHIHPNCLIHTGMNDRLLSGLYKGASENRTYTQLIPAQNENFADTMICSVISESDGAVFLIILNTEIQPVSSTVTTLRYLLIWITVIVIIISVVISYLMSRNITRSVANMNNEAKKLALGNYSVNFDGGDFLETTELADTLNYAADQLSRLDTMQKELIANISHDLRTPLTMISGYSEVMRDIPGEMTPENIQVVIDETARLTSLVGDMLDLSRITGGQRKLNKTVFSLTECVHATLSRYNRLRERDGYRFIFNCEEELFIEADEILILQVIYNLINNAINYTGDDRTVTVSLTSDKDVCRLSVTDTGEGIPSDKLPLIWDRYYKASEHHRRAVMGTGLGLSIVKNALILHGAEFGVSSTVGMGSTFWFELKTVKPDQDL